MPFRLAYPLGLLAGSLLALNAADWQSGLGFRSKALPVPATGKTGFVLLSSEQTGITFSNLAPEQMHLTNHVLLDGSGVAAGDVDGDGLCDLYFCGATRRHWFVELHVALIISVAHDWA